MALGAWVLVVDDVPLNRKIIRSQLPWRETNFVRVQEVREDESRHQRDSSATTKTVVSPKHAAEEPRVPYDYE